MGEPGGGLQLAEQDPEEGEEEEQQKRAAAEAVERALQEALGPGLPADFEVDYLADIPEACLVDLRRAEAVGMEDHLTPERVAEELGRGLEVEAALKVKAKEKLRDVHPLIREAAFLGASLFNELRREALVNGGVHLDPSFLQEAIREIVEEEMLHKARQRVEREAQKEAQKEEAQKEPGQSSSGSGVNDHK